MERARRCCEALNDSRVLRVPVSPRSNTGLRLRDLAGANLSCDLIVYWGIWREGPMGVSEHALLNTLSSATDLISYNLGVAAQANLVVTDTHALLNRIEAKQIGQSIAELAAVVPPNVRLTRMSQLAVNPTEGVSDALAALRSIPGGARLIAQAVTQASKLFPSEEAEPRAHAYVRANLAEAPHVFARWPTGIFFHIGPPELKLMLPSLPLLHGYAGPQERTRKPWFS
jgi:hypothetical protein